MATEQIERQLVKIRELIRVEEIKKTIYQKEILLHKDNPVCAKANIRLRQGLEKRLALYHEYWIKLQELYDNFEQVEVVRSVVETMAQTTKALKIPDIVQVEKLMEDIREKTDDLQDIQETLAIDLTQEETIEAEYRKLFSDKEPPKSPRKEPIPHHNPDPFSATTAPISRSMLPVLANQKTVLPDLS